MWGALLSLVLAGSPEVPPPEVIAAPVQPRRIHRCLASAEPCYRASGARLLLGSAGVLTTGTALGLIFGVGDRNRIGDPAVAFGGAGMVAIGGAILGGVAALLRGDGPALPDRITPATLSLGLSLGGSAVTDEEVPYGMSGSLAPTWTFPRDVGRLRLLGSVAGELGTNIQRDPRPQREVPDNGSGGTFATALESESLRVEAGIDLAFRLPYPIGSRSPWLGQFELRYKPLVSFTRQTLVLSDGESQRVSERIALTPLNFGFRWHLSPRQRFTFYLGPRWDFNGYGEPNAVTIGGPALAPIYGESWFDLDVPLQKPLRSRRADVVGQLTLGYIHSKLGAEGISLGPAIGFLGHVVTQFAVRVRPRGAIVAYQFELGARVGQGLSPYVRVGIVLPNIEAKR